MGKYFPEPAPFALSEREQQFMDYIARELNRVSQTLLDNADISLDEKFVEPDRPQTGQMVFADGTFWNPGEGEGFYGYDGVSWSKFDNEGPSGAFVSKSGDTMSGNLEISFAGATRASFTLDNSVGASAFSLTTAGNSTIVFVDGKIFAFQKDTEANIQDGTIAGTTVWSLNNAGLVTMTGGLTGATTGAFSGAVTVGGGITLNGIGNSLIVGSTTNANQVVEIGYTGGANTVNAIDFHTSATAVDYDVRLFASGNAGVAGAGSFLIAATGGTTIDGPLTISAATAGQIVFPASQNASAGANTLDDYEENTWTPTVTAQTGTFTTVSATGKYTKIGRKVAYTITITITTVGTAAGWIKATLPFTNNSASNYAAAGRENAVAGFMCQGRIMASATQIEVFKYDGANPIAAGHVIIMSGHYEV